MDTNHVPPNRKINLANWDPDHKQFAIADKEAAEIELKEIINELEALQELLYAEHKHKILIVLQAMDTGGKDGVIKHVFDGVNPQGVRVASFKVPTPIELDHDYLWRIHQQTPGKGEIVIFNRSHYEDVLVVRVHNLAPIEVWSKRFDQINAFERTLAEEGTTILKFFLNISKDEQRKRLQERRDDSTKQWKFNPGDLKERELWGQYMEAYEEVLSRTSTDWAPWYIVPANHKWYRNLVIGRVLVTTLQSLNMKYPRPIEDFSQIQIT
jgi:PPK2 family polyphosphate:nucleotide phosphotransferase